jgi:hypothetical protein
MADMTMTDCVAGDYLRVALSVDGDRLRHVGALAEALRGAFLIDFARLGRLDEGPNGSGLDTTPTGSDSADDLLREIDEHPTRTMERWLQRGVPHIHEVIAELMADGVWTAERHGLDALHVHYVDVEAGRFEELAKVLDRVVRGEVQPADERQAALAALAAITSLTSFKALEPLPEKLLGHCKGLEPIVRDVVTFMQAAQEQVIAAGVVSEQLEMLPVAATGAVAAAAVAAAAWAATRE